MTPGLAQFRAAARPFLRTPFHPQWLSTLDRGELHLWLRSIPSPGRVLDVGSATQWARAGLPAGVEYLALDHPQTSAAYAVRPQLYADAHALPFADADLDAVLMIDVLEHLRDPERAMSEAFRVLRPGGRLILQVPFLYPLHDVPNDHTRWTGSGLRALAARAGFEVSALHYRGEPFETAAMLAALGLAHGAARALRERRLAVLLLPLLPAALLAVNLTGYLIARVARRSDFMPYAYQVLGTRPAA